MRNYRIVVQYEGTRYRGWQRQTGTANTVQGKLEEVLGRMAGSPVTVDGAGRTDAGVHAAAQVASFRLERETDPESILEYCSRYLPEDIAVVEVREADERFHARYLAAGKRYRYRICTLPRPDVFTRRFAHHVPERLDLAAMHRAVRVIEGSHDFRSLSALKNDAKTSVRMMRSVTIEESPGEVVIEFVADGFLLHMARILSGLLIDVGLGRVDPDEVKDLLLGGPRSQAAPMAPAKGLTLAEVFYE